MKKNRLFWLIFFIFLISLFIYIKTSPKDYEINYNINQFKIKEIYDKENSTYQFNIEYQNKTYPYLITNKYSEKRELINNIEIITNEGNEICLLPESDIISFYPICISNNELVSYNLITNKSDTYKYQKVSFLNKDYAKLNINFLNNASFLLYNYKGFYFINSETTKDIELFTKDIYSVSLIYQYDSYILIPDYNEDYYFNKLYLINMANGQVEDINLESEISFTSRFLGDYKNDVYIIDEKEEKEYKINIKRKKVIETEFLIFENGKLEKKSFNEIKNNNLEFEKDTFSSYTLIENKLYQIIENEKILISNFEIDKIIKTHENEVYYLVDDNLYLYNNLYGEVLIINNFEWNFNNANMIYLFK